MKQPYHNRTREQQAREIELTRELEKLATELAGLIAIKNTRSLTVSAGPFYVCEVRKRERQG